jgi:hypothetical protein
MTEQSAGHVDPGARTHLDPDAAFSAASPALPPPNGTIAAPDGRGTIPTWSTWRQAVRVVWYWPNLKRTLTIALVVGTVLFSINQLDLVVTGRATPAVWIKSAVTYLVPFTTANLGVLVGTRDGRS